MALRTGRGCTNRSANFGPTHNPSPSTPRGLRRHGLREASQRTHAERTWGKNRQVEQKKKWTRVVGHS